MKLGQQGYKELKKRNRMRLIVAVIVVLVILLISYALLMPAHKAQNTPEREAVVNMPIAGGEGGNDRLNTGPIKTNAWLFKEAVDRGKKTEFRSLSGENEEEGVEQSEEEHNKEKNNGDLPVDSVDEGNLEESAPAILNPSKPVEPVESTPLIEPTGKVTSVQETVQERKKIERAKGKESYVKSGEKSEKPKITVQKPQNKQDKKKEEVSSPKSKNNNQDKKVNLKEKNAEGEFTIQVVALSDPIEAAGIKVRLAGKGFPARIEQVKNDDEQLVYRVRVGSYPSEDKAAQVVEQLKRAGFPARTFKR